MNNTANLLNNDDVLSANATSLMFQSTFKVSEFMTIVQSKISDRELLIAGIDCELLSPGKQWRKGKVKLRLEFIPEASEIEEQSDNLEDSEETVPGAENNGSLDTGNGQGYEVPPVDVSVPVYNNLPPSMYPDGNPNSVGMWS
ncbi:hypothetical protein BCD67_06850 [Oscillatoriales cyanobacterium USR001]|nr:hypothetical protein BCD67_06850 [Oscillatoriales cyanobacterium USR001]